MSGCCDCGDREAWKESGFCKNHKGFIDENSISLNKYPNEYKERFLGIFYELFQ